MKTNLKPARKEKGLTQDQFANQIRVSLRTYQRYESGKRIPNVNIAKEMATVLNSTVEELFGESVAKQA